MTSEPVLSINDLSIAFRHGEGYTSVVNELTMQLKPGQCMGLVGESGSGKSMTALAMMQLLPFAALADEKSQIILDGKNILDLSEREMRRVRGLEIGMIFQDAMAALNPVLTIKQQMLEILRNKFGYWADKLNEYALSLLEEVGIPDVKRCYQSYPHQLSGGMRQRAMIAIALCGEPRIIIADEPTTALDVTIQAQVLRLLRQFVEKKNVAMLFISHDLAVVSQLADEVTVLRHGELVERAEKRAFFSSPQHEYSQHLLASIPAIEAVRKVCEEKQPLIDIEHMKVHFPIHKGVLKRVVSCVKAVDDVDLTLMQGQTLALVGESGSGKTTLAKALMGLQKTNGGAIFYKNHDIAKLSGSNLRKLHKDFQIIFQDPYASLNPRMMVVDSIAEGIRSHKLASSRQDEIKRVDELLEQVGLQADYKWRYPHEFSGGERQRICIARALAVQPKLLILDEPTSALDVSIQMQVLNLLIDLQERFNLSYLLITHNLAVVAYMAHYTSVMYHGKIVESGITSDILRNPQHSYTKRLLSAIPVIQDYHSEPV